MSEWNFDRRNKLHWRYAARARRRLTKVVFMLHGTGIGWKDGDEISLLDTLKGSTLLDYFDTANVLVIAPESDTYTSNDKKIKGWDYTDYYTHGNEFNRLTRLIYLSKKLFKNVPIFIHGGSGGALSAWKLASIFEAMDDVNTLAGIVVNNGLSPYSISPSDQPPARYEGLLTSLDYSFEGHDYYTITEGGYDYVQMGFSNPKVSWMLPTLILYSLNDPIIPHQYKEDFATKLSQFSTNLQVEVAGTGHDTGQLGMDLTVQWFKNQG